MNNMLIDLQVADFINAWRWCDNGALGRCRKFFLIHNKLTAEEFYRAYEIAGQKYEILSK